MIEKTLLNPFLVKMHAKEHYHPDKEAYKEFNVLVPTNPINLIKYEIKKFIEWNKKQKESFSSFDVYLYLKSIGIKIKYWDVITLLKEFEKNGLIKEIKD